MGQKIANKCGMQIVYEYNDQGVYSITHTFHEEISLEKAESMQLIIRPKPVRVTYKNKSKNTGKTIKI